MRIVFEKVNNNISAIKLLMEQYKKSIGEEPLTENQYALLSKAVKNESIFFFTAEHDDGVVGMCSDFRAIIVGFLRVFISFPNTAKKGLPEE